MKKFFKRLGKFMLSKTWNTWTVIFTIYMLMYVVANGRITVSTIGTSVVVYVLGYALFSLMRGS